MPTTGFTPEQHRRIQTHIALIPSYVWLVYVWSLFWIQLPVSGDASQTHLVRDFLHFYTQGVIARDHDVHALYDITAMAAVAERVVPGSPPHAFPPVYGPQVALFFRPLASLSYVTALYVWLALTIVGAGLCLYLVWRHVDERMPIAAPRTSSLARAAWPVAVLALGAPGLHFTLSFAQASVIGLVDLTVLWLALRSDRLFLAGLAIGGLAYKPQLGVVAAIVFLWRREWRVAAGATLSVAIQMLAAAAYFGPSVFVGYLGALRQLPRVIGAMEPDPQLAYSMRAVLIGLHASPAGSLVGSLAVSAVAIGLAVALWRPSTPLALRYAGLVFATLLVNPHLYGYDMLLATPAMLVAGGWAWSRQRRELLVALGLVYAGPILTIVLPGPTLVTTVGLAWTLVCCFREKARKLAS